MKTFRLIAATALLASIGVASAADARPRDHQPHRHCTTQWVHHHKVTRCR